MSFFETLIKLNAAEQALKQPAPSDENTGAGAAAGLLGLLVAGVICGYPGALIVIYMKKSWHELIFATLLAGVVFYAYWQQPVAKIDPASVSLLFANMAFGAIYWPIKGLEAFIRWNYRRYAKGAPSRFTWMSVLILPACAWNLGFYQVLVAKLLLLPVTDISDYLIVASCVSAVITLIEVISLHAWFSRRAAAGQRAVPLLLIPLQILPTLIYFGGLMLFMK